jgi:hypothetical protein
MSERKTLFYGYRKENVIEFHVLPARILDNKLDPGGMANLVSLIQPD